MLHGGAIGGGHRTRTVLASRHLPDTRRAPIRDSAIIVERYAEDGEVWYVVRWSPRQMAASMWVISPPCGYPRSIRRLKSDLHPPR